MSSVTGYDQRNNPYNVCDPVRYYMSSTARNTVNDFARHSEANTYIHWASKCAVVGTLFSVAGALESVARLVFTVASSFFAYTEGNGESSWEYTDRELTIINNSQSLLGYHLTNIATLGFFGFSIRDKFFGETQFLGLVRCYLSTRDFYGFADLREREDSQAEGISAEVRNRMSSTLRNVVNNFARNAKANENIHHTSKIPVVGAFVSVVGAVESAALFDRAIRDRDLSVIDNSQSLLGYHLTNIATLGFFGFSIRDKASEVRRIVNNENNQFLHNGDAYGFADVELPREPLVFRGFTYT